MIRDLCPDKIKMIFDTEIEIRASIDEIIIAPAAG